MRLISAVSGVQVPSPPPNLSDDRPSFVPRPIRSRHITPADLPDHCVRTVERALRVDIPPDRRLRIGLAFSGGPDSLLLAWTLQQIRDVDVTVLHVDHSMDEGSSSRARRAKTQAAALDIPISTERVFVHEQRRSGESLEAAARRLRYESLEHTRKIFDLDVLATAHHKTDQAETVAMRLLSGTRLRGLAGIRTRWGSVRRPMLELTRVEVERTLDVLGLQGTLDPTNLDLRSQRNHLRHQLIPHLEAESPNIREQLVNLAQASDEAHRHLDAWLRPRLAMTSSGGSATLNLNAWNALPKVLQDAALDLLHRSAGSAYPPTRGAVQELRRQLADGRARCDCGAGLAWTSSAGVLHVGRVEPGARTKMPDFTYTLKIPGMVRIPEISASIRITEAPEETRRTEPSGGLISFSLPPNSSQHLEIRNRRPGDRFLWPGAQASRRLNRLFSQHRIRNHQRSHLPLLCDRTTIVWIPGLALDPRYLPRAGAPVWIAELHQESTTQFPGCNEWTASGGQTHQ